MGLQVIGAGLGRTGTASLKVALEQLGLGKCYHMGELIINQDSDIWIQATQGNYDWNRLFSGYGAAVDNPTCIFWRELAEYYPEAKIILTVRDANGWFDSVSTTILSPELINWYLNNPYARDFWSKVLLRDFGDQVHNRAFMVDYFEKHNNEIKETIPTNRLLVYEVKQGWEPLCNFLDKPVPNEPYPRVNSRDETQVILQETMERDPKEIPDQKFKEKQAHKLFTKK